MLHLTWWILTLARHGSCIEPCTQNYRPLIVWQFWPIFVAAIFCSIRWKTLSFKQHRTKFIDGHRYACSHSARMLRLLLRLLVRDLCELLQILCLLYSLCMVLQPHTTSQCERRLLRLIVYRLNQWFPNMFEPLP